MRFPNGLFPAQESDFATHFNREIKGGQLFEFSGSWFPEQMLNKEKYKYVLVCGEPSKWVFNADFFEESNHIIGLCQFITDNQNLGEALKVQLEQYIQLIRQSVDTYGPDILFVQNYIGDHVELQSGTYKQVSNRYLRLLLIIPRQER